MARKPKVAEVEQKEEAQAPSVPDPGTKIKTEDGKVKTYHQLGIFSIDN
jgi:hypothetical protein